MFTSQKKNTNWSGKTNHSGSASETDELVFYSAVKSVTFAQDGVGYFLALSWKTVLDEWIAQPPTSSYILYSGCWRMRYTWTFTRGFTPSRQQRDCPGVRQQSQKYCFFGGNASFSLILLFKHYKTTWLTLLSAVTVSLKYLPRCLRSAATCPKTPTTVTQSELLKTCCHVTVIQ